MGVVVGIVTVSYRKERRLVLGYPLYTVITYSCDYCAFIVGNVSILLLSAEARLGCHR